MEYRRGSCGFECRGDISFEKLGCTTNKLDHTALNSFATLLKQGVTLLTRVYPQPPS